MSETIAVTWAPSAIRRAVERLAKITTAPDRREVYELGGVAIAWQDLACLVDAGRAVLAEAPCDGSTQCPADLHRSACYGLYRTEQEVAADIYPDMRELERRRDEEQNLRRVVTVDRARNYGAEGA